MSRLRRFAHSVCFALALAGALSAQTFHERTEVFASDAARADYFGLSIAVDGDTLVVGAPADDDWTGSAYVFERSGSSWIQRAKLVASDGSPPDEFGVSVAVSGDTIVVGAHRHGDDVTYAHGAGYVFVRSGTAWVEQAKLVADDAAADDHLGYCVAIENDTIVLGAHYKSFLGVEFTGSAYVFVRSGTSWAQTAHLLPADMLTRPSYGFGGALSLSGDTLVIGESGAPFFPTTNSVYVFARNGAVWSEQVRLDPPDPTIEFFGARLSYDADTLALHGHQQTGGDAVYVFTRSGGSWTHQARLQPRDWTPGDDLWELALVGDVLVVGAHGERHFPAGQGAVYLFRRDAGTWTLKSKLVAADGESGDHFGLALDLSGGTLAAGAPFNSFDGEVAQGSAYVFEPDAGPGPRLSSVTPDVFDAVLPGTDQSVVLTGTDLDLMTTLLCDGTPIDPARYTVVGPELVTLDMPNVDVYGYNHRVGLQLLLHGLRAVGAENSDEVQVLALVPPGPVYEVGSGDPLNVVDRDDGLDLVFAGERGHRHAVFISLSDQPSLGPYVDLAIGNGFSDLLYVGTYRIPDPAVLRVHIPPAQLGNPPPGGIPIFTQTVDLTFPTPLEASNLQSIRLVP